MQSPLLRFLGGHLIVGVMVGWTALAAFMLLDIGQLGTLVWESPDWPVILAMLLIVFAITFGSLAMGTAVMGLGRKPREKRPPGNAPEAAEALQPAYAKAPRPRR